MYLRALTLSYAAKRSRIGKDPTAQTDFLPDPERDAKRLKEIEEKLYKEAQDMERRKGAPCLMQGAVTHADISLCAAQLIDVPVNFYDGNDHRRNIQVPHSARIVLSVLCVDSSGRVRGGPARHGAARDRRDSRRVHR